MSMMLVGDNDQNLYRFAGASPGVIQKDAEEWFPDIQTFKLTTNFRSTRTIVDAQRRLIAHNYQHGGGPYEDRFFKDLVPKVGALDGEPILFKSYDLPEDEAASLALSISVMTQMGSGEYQPGDIFVGARTRAQLGYLEGPLVRAKIPFINITGGSFWSSKHVADVVAYLRLAYNPRDDDSFKRIYNIASRYMTVPWKKSIDYGEYCSHRFLGRQFMESANNSYSGVSKAIYSRWSFKSGGADLVAFMNELQAELAHADTMGQVITFILDECYRAYLTDTTHIDSADVAEQGKMDDIHTVISIASAFPDADDFIAHVDECIQAAADAKQGNWDDYVVLSTVHRLKGLERKVVFGIGISEGADQYGEPRGLLPHTFSMVPPPTRGIIPMGGNGCVEDEVCVMFVAVSRAKELVFLSSVNEYRANEMGPSRFIEWLGLGEDND